VILHVSQLGIGTTVPGPTSTVNSVVAGSGQNVHLSKNSTS